MRRPAPHLLLALLVCTAPQAKAADVPAGGAALASLADADAVTLGDRPPIDSAKRLDRSLDDGRRTLSQFAPNLGRNVVGVFARENLRPLLAGAAFTGIATRLDGGTARALRGRAEDLGELGRQAGTASTIGPLALGLFVTGRAASDPRFRGLTYDIAQATIVTGLYTEIFKRAASRERPDGSDTRSFPSGHTSNAFAWAALAQHHYGTRIGVPAYAVAGLVGLSRIERDKHHLSDVVGGAALGFIVGRTVAREDGEPVRRERRVSFVPMTDANGAGLGAGVHVAF